MIYNSPHAFAELALKQENLLQIPASTPSVSRKTAARHTNLRRAYQNNFSMQVCYDYH